MLDEGLVLISWRRGCYPRRLFLAAPHAAFLSGKIRTDCAGFLGGKASDDSPSQPPKNCS
jgi:hypothetical protein